MKIVLFYGKIENGGADKTIVCLANFLVELGDEVYILITGNQDPGYPLSDKVKFHKLNMAISSTNILEAINNNRRRIILTRDFLAYNNVDVVICFGGNNLLYALMAKGRKKYRIIGAERGNPAFDDGRIWKRIKWVSSLLVDGYIFQTDGAKKWYPKLIQKRGIVIKNAILDFDSLEQVCYQKRNSNIICATARLAKEKDYPTLINAFERFVFFHPEYHLEIAGEGPEEKKLKALVNSKGLSDKIIFKGRIKNIYDFLKNGKIFVFTSLHEGMPNGLIEAMASGLACIATDCPYGPSELIDNFVNGLLVPVSDIDGLYDALELLVNDVGLAERISANAMNIVEELHPNIIFQRYREYIYNINFSCY